MDFNYGTDIKIKFEEDNIFDELILISYYVTDEYTIDMEKIQVPFAAYPTYTVPKNKYVMTIKKIQ